MKTKNDLKTGILIGIGMIVIPLIMMSTNYITEKSNIYELHQTRLGEVESDYLKINTQTGEVWFLDSYDQTENRFYVEELTKKERKEKKEEEKKEDRKKRVGGK